MKCFRTLGARATCILAALLFLLSGRAAAQNLDPPLTLDVDDRLAVIGDTITFTLTGPPDASWELRASLFPKAQNIAGFGLVFLDPAAMVSLSSGTLDANGEATFQMTSPNEPQRDGQRFFFQAVASDGPDVGVSNQVTVRLNTTAAAGARQPEAIAIPPSGDKAYVLHEEDGTVSVVDTATDSLLYDIPLWPVPPTIGLPVRVRSDPLGRHIYAVNPQFGEIVVIHRKTDSIAAHIQVPLESRDIAFDFSGDDLVYVSNELTRSIAVFKEEPAGNYQQIGNIQTEGEGPGPMVFLPDGKLMVGHRISREIEILDPSRPPGNRTVARTALASLPLDLDVWNGVALVATFTPNLVPGEVDGVNEVLEVELTNYQVTAAHLQDVGTDYWDLEVSDQHIAIAGTGSGTVALASAVDLAFEEMVELAPSEPLTIPEQLAFVHDELGGSPQKLYVINRFRETVRPIDLTTGPPFGLLPELALAHGGQPRVPGVDLSQLENGEWFYDSIAFFNGTAQNLNPVTCNTCHPRLFSDSGTNKGGKNAQGFFDLGSTGPWGYTGNRESLLEKTQGLFVAHGVVGGVLDPVAEADLTFFQENGTEVPISPHLEPDGSLSPEAQAGEIVFNGAGNCASCHEPPLFLPADPGSRTLPAGVGTGLAPANITSLRGLWATPPYLHDASAETLMDVLLNNVNDQHGTTSTLTQQQLDDLVAYLLSL